MIYFIRHAESKYNAAESAIKEKHGEGYMKSEEYQNAKFDRSFLDVELTEKGEQQCLESRAVMKDIDVDLIIVSPMRRALKTCALTF
jgi:broad specificity phosphatase PhoE